MSIKDSIPSVKGYRLYKGGNIEVIRVIDREKIEISGDVESTTIGGTAKTIVYSEGDSEGEYNAKRGKIREFSSKSRGRMAWILSTSKVELRYMSTLTYGYIFPENEVKVRSHRNRVLNLVRREYKALFGDDWLSGDAQGYFWFIEFQKRQAPHFHILLSSPIEVKKILKLWLKINQALGNDLDKVEYVHTRRDDRGEVYIMQKEVIDGGIKRYGIKYGLKMQQKIPPKWFSGRFYGYSSNFKNTEYIEFNECEEDTLRYLLEGHRANNYEIIPRYILGAFSEE